MAILNRHTDVPAERTAAEIQARLVKARAQAVMMEYDPDGVLTHLSFRVETKHGAIAFRLPANVEGVHRRLLADPRLTGKQKTREQAARVAWRICKTWVEAQLSRSDPSRRASLGPAKAGPRGDRGGHGGVARGVPAPRPNQHGRDGVRALRAAGPSRPHPRSGAATPAARSRALTVCS